MVVENQNNNGTSRSDTDFLLIAMATISTVHNLVNTKSTDTLIAGIAGCIQSLDSNVDPADDLYDWNDTRNNDALHKRRPLF